MTMKFIKNQKGITFVELMISMVVALFALSGTVYVFTNQQTLLQKQNDNTKIRGKGRQAIKLLAQEVRMAGFGLPPQTAIPNITQAEEIHFRANLKPIVRSEVQVQGNPHQGILAADDSFPVKNASGFQKDQKIMVYHPGWFLYEDHEIDDVSGNVIEIKESDFSSGTQDYLFGENAQLITVHKYNDVVIKKVGNQVVRCVDMDTSDCNANPTILVNDVSNLKFDYIGMPGTATTKVGITLGLIDPNDPFAEIEFKTDVTLRNLGLRG